MVEVSNLFDFDAYVKDRHAMITHAAELQTCTGHMDSVDTATSKSVLQLLLKCTTAARKTLSPVLQLQNCRVVDALLCDVRDQSQLTGVSFSSILQEPGVVERLLSVADVFALESHQGAERLFSQLEAAKTRWLLRQAKELTNNDEEILAALLGTAIQVNDRGLADLEQSFTREALVSFRHATCILECVQSEGVVVPGFQSMQELRMLHATILKNTSQTAAQLELWNEALDAVTRAIDLQEEDLQAWLCKADVLMNLGNLQQAEESLQRVEEMATSHPHRESIWQEVRSHRMVLQSRSLQGVSESLLASSVGDEELDAHEPHKAGTIGRASDVHADYTLFATQVWRGWRQFEIMGEVLMMQVGQVGENGEGMEEVKVTPQDILGIWERKWGLAYVHRVRFQAPEGFATQWLNSRNDFVPPYPAVTRLVVNSSTNYQSILCNLRLALLAHSKHAPKIVPCRTAAENQIDWKCKQKQQELAGLLAKAPCRSNIAGVRSHLKSS